MVLEPTLGRAGPPPAMLSRQEARPAGPPGAWSGAPLCGALGPEDSKGPQLLVPPPPATAGVGGGPWGSGGGAADSPPTCCVCLGQVPPSLGLGWYYLSGHTLKAGASLWASSEGAASPRCPLGWSRGQWGPKEGFPVTNLPTGSPVYKSCRNKGHPVQRRTGREWLPSRGHLRPVGV